jgi:hypothetical protein
LLGINLDFPILIQEPTNDKKVDSFDDTYTGENNLKEIHWWIWV